MLALLGRGQPRRRGSTLVFDEVDAGIGGHTARAVGEQLRALGAGRQILCITHLPQVASFASRHFTIVKDTTREPARTTVTPLAADDVVSELVRMLGAEEADPAARRHATRAAARGLINPETADRRPVAIARGCRRPGAPMRRRSHASAPTVPAAPILSDVVARQELSVGAAPGREEPRVVTGRVRLGRRTKLLTRRLSGGDIAVVDHENLDRVSAEDLVAVGVKAVLNCRPSSSGTYPNMGPLLLVEGGHPPRRPDRRRGLRARCATASEIVVRGGEVIRGGDDDRPRDGARAGAGTRADRRAAAGDRRGARALRPQHDRAHARGARAAGRGARAAALRAPSFATGRR